MNDQKTTVDWFRFRAQSEPRDILEALRPMFGWKGPQLNFFFQDRGRMGYLKSALILIDDMQIGRMDYGGESQRGWVSVDLTGKACEWVEDWAAVTEIEAIGNSDIRRLDLALTTWDGEITHQKVVQAHEEGQFITRGRPPSLTQIVCSDPRAGRTCYIGKREKADKFLRCYEKGFQLAAKFPDTVTHIDGKRLEDIYRCEVEFKAANRGIPWEVIERRDQYFTGSYPFCANVLPGVESDILMRRPERAPQTDLMAALANCRTQFGPTLYTALRALGGDYMALLDKVIGDHHSADLLAAGVLLVEH